MGKQENEQQNEKNNEDDNILMNEPRHLRSDTINIELLRQELGGKSDEFSFMNDDNSGMNFDFDDDDENEQNENVNEQQSDERLESFMRQKTRTRQGAMDEENEKEIFYEKG